MNIETSQQWWKSWPMWLIVGGLLLAVIASLVTIYLAFRSPDPVIDDYYRKGVEINKELDAERDAMAPAGQARNHAATGIKPQQP